MENSIPRNPNREGGSLSFFIVIAFVILFALILISQVGNFIIGDWQPPQVAGISTDVASATPLAPSATFTQTATFTFTPPPTSTPSNTPSPTFTSTMQATATDFVLGTPIVAATGTVSAEVKATEEDEITTATSEPTITATDVPATVIPQEIVAIDFRSFELRLPDFNVQPTAESLLAICQRTFVAGTRYPMYQNAKLYSYGTQNRQEWGQIGWFRGMIDVEGCVEHEGTVYVYGHAVNDTTGYFNSAMPESSLFTPTPSN